MALLDPSLTLALQEIDLEGQQILPIPAGWYTVKISEASIRTTRAGTGQYIAIRFDIVGPTHQGRVLFGNLNISNPSEIAERIGHEQLKKITEAIGVTRLVDTDQLLGGVVDVKVGISTSEEYGDRNETKDFRPAPRPATSGRGRPSPEEAPRSNVTEGGAPASTSTPPWARK